MPPKRGGGGGRRGFGGGKGHGRGHQIHVHQGRVGGRGIGAAVAGAAAGVVVGAAAAAATARPRPHETVVIKEKHRHHQPDVVVVKETNRHHHHQVQPEVVVIKEKHRDHQPDVVVVKETNRHHHHQVQPEVVVIKERRPPPPPPAAPQVVVVNRQPPAPPKPFLLSHVTIPSFERHNEAVYYVVVVTALDGASYVVKRRYSAFDDFHNKHWRHYSSLRVSPPPKHFLKHLFVHHIPDEELEQRRQGLQGYFSAIVEFARNNKVKQKLRRLLQEFLEFSTFYRAIEKAEARAAIQISQQPAIATAVAAPAPAPAPAPVLSAPPQTLEDWVVAPFKPEYDAIFNQHDAGGQGKLPPDTVKSILIQTKLPNNTLAQIWELSDIDKDGMLDNDEFSLAMYLGKIASTNQLPASLSQNYIPPSKRLSVAQQTTNPFAT